MVEGVQQGPVLVGTFFHTPDGAHKTPGAEKNSNEDEQGVNPVV